MIGIHTQELLDYCCVMLYDYDNFDLDSINNSSLVEIFIRNSLKVKSTKQVRAYFEKHLADKSAIFGNTGKNVRD